MQGNVHNFITRPAVQQREDGGKERREQRRRVDQVKCAQLLGHVRIKKRYRRQRHAHIERVAPSKIVKVKYPDPLLRWCGAEARFQRVNEVGDERIRTQIASPRLAAIHDWPPRVVQSQREKTVVQGVRRRGAGCRCRCGCRLGGGIIITHGASQRVKYGGAAPLERRCYGGLGFRSFTPVHQHVSCQRLSVAPPCMPRVSSGGGRREVRRMDASEEGRRLRRWVGGSHTAGAGSVTLGMAGRISHHRHVQRESTA